MSSETNEKSNPPEGETNSSHRLRDTLIALSAIGLVTAIVKTEDILDYLASTKAGKLLSEFGHGVAEVCAYPDTSASECIGTMAESLISIAGATGVQELINEGAKLLP